MNVKLSNARYTPEETTWVKIKNRGYSQAEGRMAFFGPGGMLVNMASCEYLHVG